MHAADAQATKVVLLALGLAIATKVAWGSDSTTTFLTALGVKLGITIGTMFVIFNGSFMVIGFLFCRKDMGVGSVVQAFFQGWVVDRWIEMLGNWPILFENPYLKALMAVVALLLFGFGCGFMFAMRLGMPGFEAMLFKISDKIVVEYKFIKIGFDVLFFLGGLLLHGVFGIMTVAFMLLNGPLSSFATIQLNRTLLKALNIDDDRNKLYRNSKKYRREHADETFE